MGDTDTPKWIDYNEKYHLEIYDLGLPCGSLTVRY